MCSAVHFWCVIKHAPPNCWTVFILKPLPHWTLLIQHTANNCTPCAIIHLFIGITCNTPHYTIYLFVLNRCVSVCVWMLFYCLLFTIILSYMQTELPFNWVHYNLVVYTYMTNKETDFKKGNIHKCRFTKNKPRFIIFKNKLKTYKTALKHMRIKQAVVIQDTTSVLIID